MERIRCLASLFVRSVVLYNNYSIYAVEYFLQHYVKIEPTKFSNSALLLQEYV